MKQKKAGITMNFKDIEYFQQLVTEKNFTKVAHFFKVSQPTVTYAIKRIENELGVVLFVRDQSHHKVELTAAGKLFSHHATSLLTELAIAKKELMQLSEEKVRFGLPPIIGNYFFHEFSQALIRDQLLDYLEIIEGGSNELTKRLKMGRIDMGVVGSIQPLRDPHLISEVLMIRDFVIVVSPEHYLATRDSISFRELAQEEFLLLNEHYIHPMALKAFATQAHISPLIRHQGQDLAILKSMIRANIGIGFLTEMAIFDEDQLIKIPITDADQPRFWVSLVRSHEAPNSLIRTQLIDIIHELLSEKKEGA